MRSSAFICMIDIVLKFRFSWINKLVANNIILYVFVIFMKVFWSHNALHQFNSVKDFRLIDKYKNSLSVSANPNHSWVRLPLFNISGFKTNVLHNSVKYNPHVHSYKYINWNISVTSADQSEQDAPHDGGGI